MKLRYLVMAMNNRSDIKKIALHAGLVIFAASAIPALAQDAGGKRDAGDKGGIPWGPVMVYPTADLTFKSDDNIYAQSAAKTSGNVTVLAPGVKLEAKSGPHTFDVGYKGEFGRYSGSSADNYADNGITANANWVFSGRSGFKASTGYQNGHDDRGSTPGTAAHTSPDEWHKSSFSGLASFGADGAQGRIEVEGGRIAKRYDNFRTDALGLPDNAKRDRDDTRMGATFYWRVMPKTQLLFQASETKFDYKTPSFVGFTNLNSNDRSYLTGVTWDAAAATTGTIKLGRVKKDFENPTVKDFSSSAWDVAIEWSPLSYSTVNLSTGQSTSEQTIGNAGLDTKYGIAWNHGWSDRVSTVASFTSTDTEFQFNPATGLKQDDTLNSLGLKLNYQWLRTLKIGLGYDYTDKASTNAAQAYKRSVYSIFLNSAL